MKSELDAFVSLGMKAVGWDIGAIPGRTVGIALTLGMAVILLNTRGNLLTDRTLITWVRGNGTGISIEVADCTRFGTGISIELSSGVVGKPLILVLLPKVATSLTNIFP